MKPTTARDDLGLIFLALMAAAYLMLMASFIGSHGPAAPTPANPVTANTAAPAVIFNGGR